MEKRLKLRVGIIGAGVSGSATAYFLREALGEHIEIVVYEKVLKDYRERIEGGKQIFS